MKAKELVSGRSSFIMFLYCFFRISRHKVSIIKKAKKKKAKNKTKKNASASKSGKMYITVSESIVTVSPDRQKDIHGDFSMNPTYLFINN